MRVSNPQSLGRSNPELPSTYAVTSRPTAETTSLSALMNPIGMVTGYQHQTEKKLLLTNNFGIWMDLIKE